MLPLRFSSALRPFALLCAVVGVLGLAGASVRGQESDWENVALQTASEAARLSSQDAAKSLTVRVQGVVTWAATSPPIFFVEDATGGIAVIGQVDPAVRADVKPGAIVDVQGVTASGDAAPSIVGRVRNAETADGNEERRLEIRFLGDGELPVPQPARAAQLLSGELADSWVEIDGVARAVEAYAMGPGGRQAVNVTFVAQGERMVATVPNWQREDLPEDLVGASVRVRGVYHGSGASRFPRLSNRFLLNSVEDIAVESPADAPFEIPLKGIGQVRSQFAATGVADRVRVRGVVTLPLPGEGMFIENGGEAMWVETPAPAKAGTSVEVAGFPGMRAGAVVLQDALWRKSEVEIVRVPPPRIEAADALGGRFHARVVRIEALLLTLSSTGEGTTLVLQSGDDVFLAKMVSAPGPAFVFPEENSWLRVTGVCVNNPMPRLDSDGAGSSFQLLLGGPDAVEVARGPTWWTLQRIMALFGVLMLAIAAMGAWATALRRRVTRQSKQIHEHLAREAVAEERVRIARELHDSVQQDLLGITMQLKATKRLLTAPEKAEAALTLASAMVRRSQAETHRAIWDLRDDPSQHPNLVVTLQAVLRGLSTDGTPAIEVTGEGQVRSLPAEIENHMLRIAQEAVTNALKHGGARHVYVTLRYDADRVALHVRDDGSGFDADCAPGAETGHFGLFGMRERALKIGGDLRITSRAGAGTAVQLGVPLTFDDIDNHPTQLASGLRIAPRPNRTSSP